MAPAFRRSYGLVGADRSAGHYGWRRHLEASLSGKDEKPQKGIEMSKTQQEDRDTSRSGYGANQATTPPNAPEQRNAGFAQGEADPAKYPQDLEIGRFSTGQDESEPIERGCFSDGRETEPKAIDPNEGFAEVGR
jgi:hypothetical protein